MNILFKHIQANVLLWIGENAADDDERKPRKRRYFIKKCPLFSLVSTHISIVYSTNYMHISIIDRKFITVEQSILPLQTTAML